jgi:pilin isopeptide linkage protein/LPXTG-motif cell wall-anchored protein
LRRRGASASEKSLGDKPASEKTSIEKSLGEKAAGNHICAAAILWDGSASENGVTTDIINGDGTVSLGSITFDQVGSYSYKAYEVAGNAEGWTYDSTVYNVTYTVTDDGAGVLGTSAFITTSDGTAADAVTFENVYTAPAPEPEPAKEEPKKPTIPNTGDATQTALPVGLAVAAAAAIAAAFVVRRKDHRSK